MIKEITYYFAFCLLFTNSLKAQNINLIDNLGRKQGMWVFQGSKQPVLEIDTAIIKCNFLNDTLHGNYQILDANEVVRYEVLYSNGRREGAGNFWDGKNNLYRINNYRNDTLYAILKLDKGRTLEIIQFNGNTEPTGVCFQYRKSGKLYKTSEYVMGELNGKETRYYRNGKTAFIMYYKNDILVKGEKYNRRGKLVIKE